MITDEAEDVARILGGWRGACGAVGDCTARDSPRA